MSKQIILATIALAIVFASHAQQYGTLKDSRDGRVYKTVKIGAQEWMAENLNAERFRNGDIIPEAKTKEEWEKAGKNKQPVWCYYDNDKVNGEKYGKLYNWYAITDKRQLAPAGMRIASSEDWDSVINQLGGLTKAGSNLKNITGWSDKDGVNGTNASGFCAMPGGEREHDGEFNFLGSWGVWWTSTRDANRSNWFLIISSSNYDIFWKSSDFLNDGYSVRCIKN
jgi:uncharacterized protein (TIGR02145 family)